MTGSEAGLNRAPVSPKSFTILILGGYGMTGRLLARHLLEETDVRLILAGRSAEKAGQAAVALNAEFAGERVTGASADAAKPASLRAALAGADFMLVAAATTPHTETIVQAALEAGVDYLDVLYAPKRYARLATWEDAICRAGRCFITEAGFHPGLPAALVHSLAPHFTRPERVLVAAVLNPEGGLPYTQGVDELIEAFRDYDARTLKDGHWSRAGAYEMRAIDFGGEFGRRTCYSMFLEELRPLPERYPSLRAAGFYIAGFNWFVDYAITPVVMLAMRLWPARAVKPMGRLLCWGTRAFAAPPYGVLLKVEVEGERAGGRARAEVSAFHEDGYELTAIPVVACLLQYLDGSNRRPGLWMMGHLADPARLLEDMERMGVRVTTTCGQADE